jgi:hypothetical protein
MGAIPLTKQTNKKQMRLSTLAINAANRLTRDIFYTVNASILGLHSRRDRIVSRFELSYVPNQGAFFRTEDTCEIRGRRYLIEDVQTCERCSDFTIYDRTVFTISPRGRRESELWCDSCVSDSARCCDSCDEYWEYDQIHFGDDSCHCSYCHEENTNEPPSYHSAKRWTIDDCYKPSYSIELEIEAGERGELIKHLERKNFWRVSWERDGSLDCEKGLEILIQHRESLNDIASATCGVVNAIKGEGFEVVSSQSKNCGLHLNCNRDQRWNLHRIMRLLWIVRSSKRLLVKVSNRESSHWASFASDGMTLREEARGAGGKYRAIRIGNDRFEWRMFKGTLKQSRIRLYCKAVEELENLACSDIPAHHLKKSAELILQSLLTSFHSNNL